MKKTFLKVTCLFLVVCVVLSVNSCKNRKTDELFEAIEACDVDTVNELLEAGVDPNTPSSPIRPVLNSFLEYAPKMPLSVACDVGNLEIVELLISYGANVDPVEGTAWSPLESTLFYCQPDDLAIVECLLENGVTISHAEYDWHPAFRASRMTPKVYDALMTNGTVFSSDYDEKTAADITAIVALLMDDFSVNDQSYGGVTLLMNAASVGNLALVEYLLSIQADLTLQDANGKIAYDYAVNNGYFEVAQLLKDFADDYIFPE